MLKKSKSRYSNLNKWTRMLHNMSSTSLIYSGITQNVRVLQKHSPLTGNVLWLAAGYMEGTTGESKWGSPGSHLISITRWENTKNLSMTFV